MPLVVAALVACGGGGGSDEAGADKVAVVAVVVDVAPVPARMAPLAPGWSAYPRLVRLSHQADPRRNGRVVASVTERIAGRWRAGLHASDDEGRTFRPLGAIEDDRFAAGLCCGTLYELPQRVSAWPAGSLLYAASVGADVDGGRMSNRLYRSDDGGATFIAVDGTCGQSAVDRRTGGVVTVGTGVWEPEFFVAADGSLACVYSDETEPGRSQVLKLTATNDGVAWSAPRVIVAGASATDRPGMANVRRLRSGRFVMTLETCSSERLDCAVRLKRSDDGLDWGDAADLGERVQTADGQYFRHAPTLAVRADPVDGDLGLLVGQVTASATSLLDPAGSGRIAFVNRRADLRGAWQAVALPAGLTVAPAESSWCANYSTALLPSLDGTGALVVQTDVTADGGCAARFASGSLAALP